MASFFNNNAFSTASLSSDQQALLLAALTSNQQANGADTSTTPREVFDFGSGSMENPMFSNGSISGFTQPDFNSLTDQQFLEYIGRGNSFDLDAVAPGDTLESPTNEDSNYELHDKRKSPGSDDEDSEDDDENGAKRRESEGKVAKKPGRKPLTTEPTTKRKAQNRAAQRAFRERKERHLKDLETKVAELEKSSESVNHENGLLRAQVDKLTNELKESRKRLSVQSLRTSPQSGSMGSLSSTGLNGLGNTFNFDIPQFGSPSPYAQLFNSNSNRLSQPSIPLTEAPTFDLSTAGLLQRADSTARSPGSQAPTPAMSDFIKSPHHSISADSPSNRSTNNSFFNANRENSVSHASESPSTYNIFTSSSTGGFEPNTNMNNARSESGSSSTRVFQFRSGSRSNSSSTSPSSNYNAGPSSSCGTSPEPSGHANMTAKDGSLEPINEKNVMNSTSTPATSAVLDSVIFTEEPADQSYDLFSLAGQPKDPFAPMSWVDYGENSMNMFGDGSFTGGSYMNDFSSSFNMDAPMSWNDLTTNTRTGLTPAVQKSNPIDSNASLSPLVEELRAQQAADPKKLVPCHKIWDKIQHRPDFKDGTLDIDSLCTELRQKAKCSENGVVIDQKDVDAALHRIPPTPKTTL